MGSIRVSSDVREARIEATIIRADGRREPLGTVSYYHRNPLKRLAWRLKEMLRGKRRH